MTASMILTTYDGFAIAVHGANVPGQAFTARPRVLDPRFDTVQEALDHAAAAGLGCEICPQRRWVSWIVPAHRVEAIKGLADEINAKAAKRGTGGMQVWFGSPEVRRVEIQTATGSFKADRMVCLMEAIVEVPKIAGWHVRAVLDHSLWTKANPANIVANIDQQWTLPAAFRSARPACDHCGTSRRRGKTVILQNDAGDLRQIGLTCLEAYTGKDPAGALSALSSFDQIGRACSDEDDDWPFPKVPRSWPLGEYLAAVAAVIRVDGWISRKAADEKLCAATADVAVDLLAAWRKGRADVICTRMIDEFGGNPTDRDLEVAERAWQWAKSLDVKSDYDHNVRAIAQAGFATVRWIGIAASMVAGYLRETQQQAEAAAKAAAGGGSKPMGAVGDRVEVDVTVIGRRVMDGYYGTCTLLKFVTADGDLLMTFASGDLRVPDGDFGGTRLADVGDQIRIRGTVKDHKDFRGEVETSLSRVAIAPPPKAKKVRGHAA